MQVFDVLRKNKRRMATFSFWRRILVQSKWFTIQFSLMGSYGLYVTIRPQDFLPPKCIPQLFKDRIWSIFLYGFAAAPIINSCMLFMTTSFFVWIASVLVALFTRKGWRGQVDPVVFCVFWLLEYIVMIGCLVFTIETQLKKNTSEDDTRSPFGSTLALALVIVPLKLVVVRAWQLIRRHDTSLARGSRRMAGEAKPLGK
jgi:hypothetical protein